MTPDDFCIRLFLSADLVGSTAYKNSRAQTASAFVADGYPAWAKELKRFYSVIRERFSSDRELSVAVQDKDGSTEIRKLSPTLVKTLGDELLFECELLTHKDADLLVSAFCRTLEHYNLLMKDEPLAVKGAAWIAGFPVNNHRIELGDQIDFIGPSIDAGFRVAANAGTDRLVVSVDLGLLLTTAGRQLYFDGTQSLKGVLGGKPYPRLFRPIDDDELPEFSLRGHTRPETKALAAYCEDYITSVPPNSWLTIPYFRSSEESCFTSLPTRHEDILRKIEDANTAEDEAAAHMGSDETAAEGYTADLQNAIDAIDALKRSTES